MAKIGDAAKAKTSAPKKEKAPAAEAKKETTKKAVK